jgi:hypothetical protein
MQSNSNPGRDDRRFETSMEVCQRRMARWRYGAGSFIARRFSAACRTSLIGSAFPLRVSRIACRTKTRLAQNVLQNKATPQGLVRFPRCFLIRHGKRQRALWNLCL